MVLLRFDEVLSSVQIYRFPTKRCVLEQDNVMTALIPMTFGAISILFSEASGIKGLYKIVVLAVNVPIMQLVRYM